MSLLAPEPGQVQSSATPQPGPLADEGDKGWDRCFTKLLVYTETNEGEISSSAPWARTLSHRTEEGRLEWRNTEFLLQHNQTHRETPAHTSLC